MAAKLLVLYFLLDEWDIGGEVFLPFFRVLDLLPFQEDFLRTGVWGAYIASSLLLLFNRAPRINSAIAGTLILWGVAASRIDFSNSRLAIGLFLVLIGLSGRDARWGSRVFCIQISLIYLGATVSKLLDPDWRGGVFMHHFCGEILDLKNYHMLAEVVGSPLAATALSWAVILIEASLALGFLLGGRRLAWFVGLGLSFHVGMLVFTKGELSWNFLYVMSCGFLCAVEWRRDWSCWRGIEIWSLAFFALSGCFWILKASKWHGWLFF